MGGTPRFFLLRLFDYASANCTVRTNTDSTSTALFPPPAHGDGLTSTSRADDIASPPLGVDVIFAENKDWARKLWMRAQYLGCWRANYNDSLYHVVGLASSDVAVGAVFVGA